MQSSHRSIAILGLLLALLNTAASCSKKPSGDPIKETAEEGVAAILGRLGLARLLPVFTEHGITSRAALLLLDHNAMLNYMGITDLTSRLFEISPAFRVIDQVAVAAASKKAATKKRRKVAPRAPPRRCEASKAMQQKLTERRLWI